jgi:hypothetical protein
LPPHAVSARNDPTNRKNSERETQDNITYTLRDTMRFAATEKCRSARSVHRQPHRQKSRKISVRRLRDRPSGLSDPSGFVLGSSGRSVPSPSVTTCSPETPRAASAFLTAKARAAPV